MSTGDQFFFFLRQVLTSKNENDSSSFGSMLKFVLILRRFSKLNGQLANIGPKGDPIVVPSTSIQDLLLNVKNHFVVVKFSKSRKFF